MNSLRFAAAVCALFLSACADDLSPEQTDKPAAPYSSDPMSHVPAPPERDPLGAPRI